MVRLLDISSTSRSLYLNYGSLDGVKNQEWAILFGKRPGHFAEKKSVYFPVAKIKAVKVSSSNSIWLVFKIYDRSFLRQNANLGLITEGQVQSGRSKLLIRKKTLIANKNEMAPTVNEHIKNDGNSMVKHDDDFAVIEEVHKLTEDKTRDIEVVDLEAWERGQKINQKIAKSIFHGPEAYIFHEKKRFQDLEAMAYSLIKHSNLRTDGEMRTDKTFVWSENLHATQVATENKIDKDKEHMLKDLSSQGERWSENYSDDELKTLLTDVASLREKERKRWLYSADFSHQLYLAMGMNLLANELYSDPDGRQAARYDGSLLWEFYPFRMLEDLRSISFGLSARFAQDNIVSDDLNGTSQEASLAFNLFWYPTRLANALDMNIPYLGLRYRQGVAQVNLNTVDESGTYQVWGVPELELGIKYNFYGKTSLRFYTSYARLLYDRIQTSEGATRLEERLSLLEGKIGFSIGMNL